MKRTLAVVGIVVCCVLAAGSSSSEVSEREFRELRDRVEKLEDRTSDFERAFKRLEKAVSGMPKDAAEVNRETERQFEDLRKSVASLERSLAEVPRSAAAADKELDRKVAALNEAMAAFDRSSSQLRSDLSDVAKRIQKVGDRSDARTLLLAEWLDKYHKGSHGSHHRDAVKRCR